MIVLPDATAWLVSLHICYTYVTGYPEKQCKMMLLTPVTMFNSLYF